MNHNRITDFVQSSLNEAVQLLKTLGRIPAPSRQEDQRAKFCLDWFARQGAQDVWMDEQKNVVCALDCDQHRDIAVFMAHTDIVFDDQDLLPMRQEGRRLYAPGIGDNTANLVNLMMAAKYMIQNRQPLKRGVLIVANACEEGLGNLDGARRIFDQYGDRITECYSFDGYLSQCTSRPVGSNRYRITVEGEGGHSYLNFGNQNAILQMAELIHDLYRVKVPTEAKTTYNVGRISGGSTVNSIAQSAEILYEYRSASQSCLESMEKAFKALIDRHRSAGVKIQIELLGHRPGLGDIDIRKLDDWTRNNIQIIRRHYTGPMNLKPQSTDSNIPLSRGQLANTIGTIVGKDAHKREEWIDLDSIPTGLAIVLDLLLQTVQP